MTSHIRLSKDVAEIAAQLAEAKGLGHPRVAVEAVFRTCWRQYLNGTCDPVVPMGGGIGAIAPPAAAALDDEPINAAAALDDVL